VATAHDDAFEPLDAAEPEPEPEPTPAPGPEPAPAREPALAPEPAPEPPPTWELPHVGIPAGMVWPQVRGRGALSSLTPPGTRTRGPARAWAPRDPLEITCPDWIAHSSAAWRFDDLDDGRRALLEVVRWQTRLGALTPSGRTIALCPERDGVRLWMLTPLDVASCWDRLVHTLRAGAPEEVEAERSLALSVHAFVRGSLARLGFDGEVALDQIAFDGEPRYLAPPPTASVTDAAQRLAAQLAHLERAPQEG